MANVEKLWVYLAETPLLWLAITLTAYTFADWISSLAKRHPLVNPIVIATGLIIAALSVSHTDYKTYFGGAQFVHFMLGPATVALAIPLVDNLSQIRRSVIPISLALVAGSATAILSAVGTAWLFGAPHNLLMSLAPKSVTTPIAMGLSETLGGIPSLTAVLVVATGIFGAITVTPLMNLMRINDPAARGFAVGLTSHGMGTARAFQVNALAGTFAGLAMGLNGLMTALLAPLLAGLF
ncbi:putative murein hydrolase (TIGR00659 family) [Breoghania corrubedonensis]|uniref:Putative murein hydrolase (TIGR00659 family) n=1 Tax=Breoghania corrubedonensis TaxID=665038 RepID=A0A2T5VCN4_9HYPH|nr:LrgB family protein [Breoghania corrubedonensis]PTW61521.1 putative murein hydrolase (TIGR00659 family) [Breoghania corrubedonensis]